MHMLLLPGAIAGLILLHLYLVVRLGVSSPPWSTSAAGAEPVETEPRGGAGASEGPREARAVSRAQDERRAEFKRYKEDVERRGRPSTRTRCSTTR